MRNVRFGVWAAILLSGCAPLEAPREEVVDAQRTQLWEAHQRQVEKLTDWGLEGRFGIQWPDGQVQGGLQWHQTGDVFELRLSGPFGLNPTRVVGDLHTGQAVLHEGETETRGAIETVMRQHLGFVLPLAEMADLVRGIPTSETGQIVLDEQARAVRILQNDWEIEYRDYSCCEAPTLPGRIRFAQDALRGVLVVRVWNRE